MSHNMRDKLRKVKHKLSSKKRRFSAFDSSVGGSRNTSCAAEISTQASLLGLPPEIRNEIYEYLSLETILVLPCTKPRKPSPPIGLLLACKQLWKEYRTLLLTQAAISIHVTDYNFSNMVRVFENMSQDDISILKTNTNLCIELYISHVPSREDRKALQSWCCYRASKIPNSYFNKSGNGLPQDLVFQYKAKYLPQIRPPRPVSRYTNGYQMKSDLLRTHVRMAGRLQSLQSLEDDTPNEELTRVRVDLEDCVRVLDEAAAGSQPG